MGKSSQFHYLDVQS